MKDIGKRLKIAREAIGLDQAGWADRLRVSRATISRWELGQGFPPADVLWMMNSQFRIDPTWIVTGHGGMLGWDSGAIHLTLEQKAQAKAIADDINMQLLQSIIEGVEKLEETYGKKLGAAKKARLICFEFMLSDDTQHQVEWEIKRRLFELTATTDEPKSDD